MNLGKLKAPKEARRFDCRPAKGNPDIIIHCPECGNRYYARFPVRQDEQPVCPRCEQPNGVTVNCECYPGRISRLHRWPKQRKSNG